MSYLSNRWIQSFLVNKAMETNRRAEKRGKVLASLRAEFQALGVQNPILPTDIDCPKRKFERDMFEARQSLRRLESSQKVLGSLLDYLENSSPTIEFDEQQPWLIQLQLCCTAPVSI